MTAPHLERVAVGLSIDPSVAIGCVRVLHIACAVGRAQIHPRKRLDSIQIARAVFPVGVEGKAVRARVRWIGPAGDLESDRIRSG